MTAQFSTLIILTLICAVLLAPFAVSPIYLDGLRSHSMSASSFHNFSDTEPHTPQEEPALLVM